MLESLDLFHTLLSLYFICWHYSIQVISPDEPTAYWWLASERLRTQTTLHTLGRYLFSRFLHEVACLFQNTTSFKPLLPFLVLQLKENLNHVSSTINPVVEATRSYAQDHCNKTAQDNVVGWLLRFWCGKFCDWLVGVHLMQFTAVIVRLVCTKCNSLLCLVGFCAPNAIHCYDWSVGVHLMQFIAMIGWLVRT